MESSIFDVHDLIRRNQSNKDVWGVTPYGIKSHLEELPEPIKQTRK